MRPFLTVTAKNTGYNGPPQPNASFQVRRPNGDTSVASGYPCAD